MGAPASSPARPCGGREPSSHAFEWPVKRADASRRLTGQVRGVELLNYGSKTREIPPQDWPACKRSGTVTTGTVKQGKDRHQEILDAAARVITERGLAETRISDIAEQAGVSPGLILYYFESKDRLLAEALTFANDQFYLRTSREIRRIP